MNFSELNLKREYHSLIDDIINDFYNPVLSRTIMYKRAVGFFSSYGLKALATGVSKLLDNGGKIQLISAPHLSTEDVAAISYGLSCRDIEDKTKLIEQTKIFQGNFNKVGLNLLSNLIALEVLEIKIAFIENSSALGTFNEKMGLMYDRDKNIIAFSGSINESENSLRNNYNSIDVFLSWKKDAERVQDKEKLFDLLCFGIIRFPAYKFWILILKKLKPLIIQKYHIVKLLKNFLMILMTESRQRKIRNV